MDFLRIKDLVVHANHGVFAAEKELGQRFILDVELGYDMSRAAQTGDLTASVHYGELAEKLTAWCQERSEDLIETLAEKLIERIFEEYPLVQSISLEVKKPWAPIPLPLETCSVKLNRQKQTVFIGLGSNLGQREENLALAQEYLQAAGLEIVQASSQIETEPWGGVEQAAFLNQVLQVQTWLTPQSLLAILLGIEEKMGRVREVKWGPRVIDLDILYIDQEQIYSQNLIVPHPYVAERAFVLESLAEIAPHFTDPRTGQPMRKLYEESQSFL